MPETHCLGTSALLAYLQQEKPKAIKRRALLPLLGEAQQAPQREA
jgi:hypothetical protein